MIAEESTSWPAVSRPTYVGGLGFDLKWNMGWMNDTLRYMALDPLYRQHHHGELTFSMLYAFHENFILPLSHDEVVHGKRTLLEKMPGDDWQKFANLRLLYGYQFAHPGQEAALHGQRAWGQRNEFWEGGIGRMAPRAFPAPPGYPAPGGRPESPARAGASAASGRFRMVRIRVDGSERRGRERAFVLAARPGPWKISFVVVCNFTPVVREEYRVGVPRPGYYREILNTDSKYYGGTDLGNAGGVNAEPSRGTTGRTPLS